VVFVKTCDSMGTSNSGCKGAQGGMWVVGGRERSTQTWGEKKEKQSHLFEPTQKRDLLIVLYVCC